MVTKRVGGRVGAGGGGGDAPLTSLFIKCGEFRQDELLSATQEVQLHEAEWQNGIDDKRRIAIEGVGG
jgi:hypothetical protein